MFPDRWDLVKFVQTKGFIELGLEKKYISSQKKLRQPLLLVEDSALVSMMSSDRFTFTQYVVCLIFSQVIF